MRNFLFLLILSVSSPYPLLGNFGRYCDDACHKYTNYDVIYRSCVLVCKDSKSSRQDSEVYLLTSDQKLDETNENDNEEPRREEVKDLLYPSEYENDLHGPRESTKRDIPSNWRKVRGFDDEQHERMSFVRIGRSRRLIPIQRPNVFEKRLSSFVRIGRMPRNLARWPKEPISQFQTPAQLHEAINEQEKWLDTHDWHLMNLESPLLPSSAAKVMRAVKEKRSKRASSFIRIGKSYKTDLINDQIYSNFTAKNFSNNEEENVSTALYKAEQTKDESNPKENSFARMDKTLSNEEDKRASSFIRIGKSPIDDEGKRASSFVRIGKSPITENDKRASSFIRIGKSPIDEDDKRASSFVRIGKPFRNSKDNNYLRRIFGIGRTNLNEDEEKRASSFVRIGRLMHPEKDRYELDVQSNRKMYNSLQRDIENIPAESTLDELQKRSNDYGPNPVLWLPTS